MYRPTPERDGRFGFTLIELLIVVAIIAILAAIAIPNFLEAQTRSRVSRTKGDLRTCAIALDSYFVDHSKYVRDSSPTLDVDQNLTYSNGDARMYASGVLDLTTPLTYMSSVLNDPFAVPSPTGVPATSYCLGSGDWSYTKTGATDDQNSYITFANHLGVSTYVLVSCGPDLKRNRQAYKCFPWRPEGTLSQTGGGGYANTAVEVPGTNTLPTFYLDYDPTNGTVSVGDIQRFGGDFTSGNWNRFYQNDGGTGAGDGSGSGPGGASAN
jgi:prepilin-type N-terminal cleavage/methylation domain-containing protein